MVPPLIYQVSQNNFRLSLTAQAKLSELTNKMARIYISSTYSDLKEFREEVYRALRKLGHDVVAMEDYTATDQRPLDKCLDDVAGCDVYLGIFAWRYGYIPPEQDKSITELEFRAAVNNQKLCLLFLLHEEAEWRKSLIDREIEKIEMLREELKRDFLVEFFSNKDELAGDIGIAVSRALGSERKNEENNQPRTLRRDNSEEMNQILKILKPIIIVFLSILAITILTMILCIAVPSVREGIDLKLALYGLGSISTFLICCLMFIFNKFVQIARRGN